MEITEKVAYLKGLTEGLALDTETKEGKIISAMIDILDDMALELQDHQDQLTELSDGLDAVSDDLEDVEDIVYDVDEADYDDEDEDEEDDDSEDCYATTCPTCEETIYFDESILEDGEVICPNCGEKLEFDLSDVEEDNGGEDDGE
ncbi:CD1247 N-terminal domain-containing protein [uncultured Oscillibacter sp.]|uniref:CD1247 N-terminal domain-containing protein n=1 Tax=uncultured Oscillibacter sp. TaxID=876091 RepID=UPI0025FE7EE5|nr:CD1247 N-terminal domain-containing protein [uncultured Oscillibacter sp.]